MNVTRVSPLFTVVDGVRTRAASPGAAWLFAAADSADVYHCTPGGHANLDDPVNPPPPLGFDELRAWCADTGTTKPLMWIERRSPHRRVRLDGVEWSDRRELLGTLSAPDRFTADLTRPGT